jgi:hypothetical protein
MNRRHCERQRREAILYASKFASSAFSLLDPASLKQLKGKLESTLWVAMTDISS